MTSSHAVILKADLRFEGFISLYLNELATLPGKKRVKIINNLIMKEEKIILFM